MSRKPARCNLLVSMRSQKSFCFEAGVGGEGVMTPEIDVLKEREISIR